MSLFFFDTKLNFTLYISSNNEIREGLGRDSENGHKQCRCVVWVLGESFLFFLRFFLILSTSFTLYISSNNEIREGLGRDSENGPKRCQMLRLGPR